MSNYKEYKQLHLPSVDKEVLEFWQSEKVFEKSVENRASAQPFVFYEGPPSANGLPGIHHVMSRTLKDLFCRYKSLKGFKVERKGGWDTHGLPVELGVEKKLGITKEDIGVKISVEEYNEKCRQSVLEFKADWDRLTTNMGYWVDLDNPYITFDNNYIESIWWILKQLYQKGYLYKGYTIQPFSPAAGTGLSSHELNLPGAYRNIKDTSVVAQFKRVDKEEYFLAWTTTPWTLPSNTALAVGENITYVKVKTFNPYTFLPVTVILAKDLMGKYFKPENAQLSLEEYEQGQKEIPYQVLEEVKGKDLAGIRYEQLMPYVQPTDGDAFKVIIGDFVSTEDGTGIVHIAPSFGADDMRVARQNGIGSLTLVDRRGRFVPEVTDFANLPVKNYDNVPEKEWDNKENTDIKIAIKLKQENKAFKVEKYDHNYPHCWRTDKPVIYYPLDSWFIRTTAVKDRMVELNKTINWKPASTGTGRFGNWLENLVDWNLSRSRYWGTPLPIWRTEDGQEELCIGSVEELKSEVEKSIKAGFMDKQLPENFDLHKPFVDAVYLVSPSGKKMVREADLIDVWFDSGAMPYAQWHYPFENKEQFEANFPADFIAEGMDQTRGWFFTLHAIGVLLKDSIAFKNVVSNGLLLDKNGNKMSKRLGNVVNPFETLDTYGADATRWYMMSNSQPWDNLKFDIEGIKEVQRKFFGTLYNTYSFFALYANIDGFKYREAEVPLENRPEIDRWIISLLNTLISEVDAAYDDYEPTKAARAIQDFVDAHLSNWYVRLCRRRFWKGEYNEDKIAAYQTLYRCLEVLAQLMSPIAPFFADRLFRDLNGVSGRQKAISVHLSDFPVSDPTVIDKALEERMQMAQDASSLVLSLRKKQNIKVRQPLNKILVPVINPSFKEQFQKVEHLVLSEVNVKEVEYLTDTSGIITKEIKPDLKKLGAKLGPKMKPVTQAIATFSQEDIRELEVNGEKALSIEGEQLLLKVDEVLITSKDIPGWLVASEGSITVALDITITDELKDEGNARELVNRIQNLRKEKDFNVTDRISLRVQRQPEINSAIDNFKDYICTEVLAENLSLVDAVNDGDVLEVNGIFLNVAIHKN
ncbi:MAG: isoleucine--tRNA ligase [Chitinophagales bacterium]|nr:isoleucine--tRNA ligase [Chitinophagales bacterium]